jgi:hypothetical protein
MKTCVLHIGTEKTGTTALQEWLYDNKSKLSRRGFFLSNKIGVPNNRLFPAYFSQMLDDWAQVNKIHSIEEKTYFFRKFEATMSEDFRVALKDHDYFIISSEHLHSRITERDEIMRIKAFLDAAFDRVLIVCYFRNQLDLSLSLFSTSLKVGHSTSLDAFSELVHPEMYFYNYENIADNWSSVFGKENCVFRIYDRRKILDGDIRKDFLSILGLEHSKNVFHFAARMKNQRLSHEMASAFRMVNIALPFINDKRFFFWRATWLINKATRGILSIVLAKTTGKLEYSNASEVDARFKDSNSRFFDKYFHATEHF